MDKLDNIEKPRFSHRRPTGRLSDLIDIFWYWQEKNLLQGLECILPTGCAELVIDLESNTTGTSVICGLNTRPRIIKTKKSNHVSRLLGIHFKPGGIFPFLEFPSNELTDKVISLDHIWRNHDAEKLIELLQDSKNIAETFNILENWLLNKLLQPPVHTPFVSTAISGLLTRPGLKTGELCRDMNITQRRFIQVFQSETGLTPKLFSRINRFQKTLGVIEESGNINWASTAFHCGYYDQAHFIHDFKKFSGITPTTYLNIRTEHPNHLPRKH